MKITKIFTGDDNKSYFMEVPIDHKIQEILGKYSQKYECSGFMFREFEGNEFYDWHPAPQPQYIIYLEGEVEVTASGGEKKIFKPGDILFATDVTGAGHTTRTLLKGRSIIIITI